MAGFLDQHAICTLALEAGVDDYTGLYEVILELNGKFPEVSEAEKIAAATAALSALLNEGQIELYRTEWPPTVYEPLALDEALKAMGFQGTWQMSQDGPNDVLVFCTTAQGQDELARRWADQGEG